MGMQPPPPVPKPPDTKTATKDEWVLYELQMINYNLTKLMNLIAKK